MVRRQAAALRCAPRDEASGAASLTRRAAGWLLAAAAAGLTLALSPRPRGEGGAERPDPADAGFRTAPSPREVVAFLSSPALDGRRFGSDGEARAAVYVAEAFERLGLPPPPGHPRFQPVSGEVDGQPLRAQRGSVLAWLDAGAVDTLVLSAHHDHLGHGGPLSREPLTDALHPGADDNASGVALLLSLAERLAQRTRPLPVNVLFLSSAGEEQGLLGAQAFVAAPPVPLERVRCFINFDMVGRLDLSDPILAVEGTQERPALAALVAQVPPRGFTVRTEVPIFPGGTDHSALHGAGVPVLGLSSGVTADYHRPSDRAETINFAGLEAVSDYAMELVDVLAAAPGLR